METKTVKCIKCQKSIQEEDGKKTNKGYLCQSCVSKSKKKSIAISSSIVGGLALIGIVFWITQRPENIEGYSGVQNVQEDVNIEISSQPFSIANLAAESKINMSLKPIDNIESFKQALEKSKTEAEELYNTSDSDEMRKSIKFLIPQIASHFPFNSASINPETESLLKEYASIYNQTDKTASILVEGFACNIGTDNANDSISFERADAVRNYLVKLGIPVEKIKVESFGKRRNSEFSLSSISEYRRVLVSIQ